MYKRMWRSKGLANPKKFPKSYMVSVVVLLGGGDDHGAELLSCALRLVELQVRS
jgi:hypothetical protein